MKAAGASASDIYYLTACVHHNGSQLEGAEALPYVEKAVLGHCETIADAAGKEDITAKLFGEKGYGADFSGGITITVILKEGYFFSEQ